MSINKIQLGKSIRQIRELRGYSQEELGVKSGLRGNTVALIERGQRGVSIDSLNELAKVLKIPAACLTMLGTSELKGDSASTGLVKSMQELILSTVVAQTRLQAKEESEPTNRARVKSRASSTGLQAIAQKIFRASKGKKQAGTKG